MKNLVILTMMVFAFSTGVLGQMGQLDIGDKAVLTDVKMTDISGEKISLNDVKGKNGLVVLFSCNTCPFVLKWEDRYNDVKAWADKNKVGMVVLNSNYKKRSGADSLEAMRKKAAEKGYQFRYVVDHESQVANAFGGKTTPHVFVFDNDFNLAYKGAIDDNYDNASKVSKPYLKDAISGLATGAEIAVTETSPIGCSIKRKTD